MGIDVPIPLCYNIRVTMNKEHQDYYENFFDLFAMAGWKQLVEDLESSAGDIKVRDLADAKALYIAQGKLDILERLVSFQDRIRNSYDQIVLEEALGDD